VGGHGRKEEEDGKERGGQAGCEERARSSGGRGEAGGGPRPRRDGQNRAPVYTVDSYDTHLSSSRDIYFLFWGSHHLTDLTSKLRVVSKFVRFGLKSSIWTKSTRQRSCC
jgi:hypothetical protein